MDLNYFTCTLGQAAAQKRTAHFTNINDFLEQQASEVADLPAVGLYSVRTTTSTWEQRILSFREVYDGASTIAKLLPQKLDVLPGQTVALLCPSSADFLFTWLALMHLGHPVLLIAPQCAPNAVAHLCKQCNVTALLHDDIYDDLVQKSCSAASELGVDLRPYLLPSDGGQDIFEMLKKRSSLPTPQQIVTDTDIAYLHHTSGTSTGVPKPIPQSHRAAAGVLPRLEGSGHATFTTTPLYHGGIADLFRAWTSNALIWLFPGKEVPITAANVVKCLEIADHAAVNDLFPPVKYFSSVPYVLQMMAGDDRGKKHIQRMDIVGVGGAALPAQVGDDLVRKGIKLVSRFGSAECGFLLSSHRDYAKDQEWQYLRPGAGLEYLRFEPRDAGLSELVILPGWPHMAKTNRDDGSFATSDLFAPHPEIPNAWRYHSRADSQLTLITGRKFDPSPLESAIAALTPLLSDVLIFGNGKPYPGALLFRSSVGQDTSDIALVEKIAEEVAKLNAESQSHARIPRNMLVPMPYAKDNLEKSSKGTILRGRAEERYEAQIDGAYDNMALSKKDVPDQDVERTIQELVDSVVGASNHGGHELEADTDLFAYGVDSVACVQIRHALSQLLPENSTDLPLTIVEDSGTVQHLSDAIISLRHGKQTTNQNPSDQLQLMRDLVEQYSQLSVPDLNGSLSEVSSTTARQGKTVLLTGPTGTLGSHLLSQLLSSTQISHVHLLLRGTTQNAARERVVKALTSRDLPIPSNFDEKVSIHTCTLSDSRLGLSDSTYSTLAKAVDVIVHLAWSVNFLLPLRSFKQHFAGLQALLNLSLARPHKPMRVVFCSSTAAVASYSSLNPHEPTPEQVIADPRVSGPIGYSRSKWVAENICSLACKKHSELWGLVSVVRVGQVSGDTVNGVWNKSEAYPLMLSSAKVTGCLPDLQNEHLGWIPVDVAARAFLELCLGYSNPSTAVEVNDESAQEVQVCHVLNQDRTVTWTMLLAWLTKGENFEVVNINEWLHRLEDMQNSEDETKRNHPCLKLLGFWKEAYSNAARPDVTAIGDGPQQEGEEKNGPTKRKHDANGYTLSKSLEAMLVLHEVKPVDEAYSWKLWSWIKANV